MWVCIQYENSRETIKNRVLRLQYTKQYKNMEFMRCMTGHRIKNNPLSSFENKTKKLFRY
jgi:hypothetical protein